jgi:peptidyl-prolyl cis-trans isomerase B (cyclophilin B)
MKLRGLRDTGELWKFSNTMTKRSLISSSLWLLLGGFTALHAQNAPAPAEPPAAQSPAPAPAPARELAVVRTSKGEMTIEFWEDVAPKTVANFKELAKKGFYNGTAFHRIIKGFMIQGGDPLSKDPSKEAMYGTGDPGYKIKAEFNEKKHVRGVISMARAFDPDSAGSQFFICLDAAPNLDRQYTGFGRLVKGEDVLVAIGDTPVASNGRERSRPAERVTVESVKIVPASDTAAPAPAPAAPAAQPAPAPPAK